MKEVEFVDLGLPSGTLWARHNVQIGTRKHFTYNEAVKIAKSLHSVLPFYDTFHELITECTWKWVKLFGKTTGYKVTGPNGKSIFLSAAGYREDISLYFVGYCGGYWAAEYCDSYAAGYLVFDKHYNFMSTSYRRYKRSIRLVKYV